MAVIELLLAVPRERAAEYYNGLSSSGQFHLTLHADAGDALASLEERSQYFDAFVLDSRLEGATMLLEEARFIRPHLLTVVVNTEGQAALDAEYSCAQPFEDDELARQLIYLLSDRQLETVSANSLPPVRRLARRLRAEDDRLNRYQITVDACRGLGYAYSAFYAPDETNPEQLELCAHSGPPALLAVAQQHIDVANPIAQVAYRGEYRIFGLPDAGEIDLIRNRHLTSLACVPCGGPVRFGVLLAGRTEAEAITPNHVMMLELVAAQLAASLAREMGG